MNIDTERLDCCEVSLIEQLRSVPKDARQMIEINPTHHRNIPYGVLCQKAADEIESLRAALDKAMEGMEK